MHTFLIVVLAVFASVAALSALVLGTLFFSGRILGLLIKTAIERGGKDVVGVGVTFGRLDVSLWTMKVSMRDLQVHNPPRYSTSHLVKAGTAVIDISALTWLRNLGKKIRVESLIFKDVDANFEVSGLSSNFKEVKELVKAKQSARQEQVQQREEAQGREVALLSAGGGGQARRCRCRRPKRKARSVMIQQVAIEGVSVKVCARTLGGMGARISLPDVRYSDFSAGHRVSAVEDMVVLVVFQFFQTVMEKTASATASVLNPF